MEFFNGRKHSEMNLASNQPSLRISLDVLKSTNRNNSFMFSLLSAVATTSSISIFCLSLKPFNFLNVSLNSFPHLFQKLSEILRFLLLIFSSFSNQEMIWCYRFWNLGQVNIYFTKYSSA